MRRLTNGVEERLLVGMVNDPVGHRRDLVAAARSFFKEGRLQQAQLLLDDILSADPHSIDGLALRASASLMSGDKARAAVILSELTTAYPDRADFVAELGLTHVLDQKWEEARICFERAVVLEPDEGKHRCALIGVLLALEDLPPAKEHLGALFAIAKRNGNADFEADACSLTARLKMTERDLPAAEQALLRARGLRPGHASDLRLLSDLSAELGKTEDALAFAQEAYAIAPEDHEVVVTLAGRLMGANRLEEAERYLRRTLVTAPHHADATFKLASLMVMKGEGEKALALFAGIVRRTPDQPKMVLQMATLMRANGDLEKALSFVDVVLKQAPKVKSAAWFRKTTLLAMGRMEDVWPLKPIADPKPPAAIFVPPNMPAGDALFLARFVRRLVPEGERIVCHAEPELQPLLVGVSGILCTSSPSPEEAVPLTALPERVGVGEDFTSSPYLAVEEERYARWRHATGHLPRPLVGLFWDEAAPGLTLAELAAAVTEGLKGQGTLISLAFDKRRAQLSSHPAIMDAATYFSDAREMVAAIAQLDFTVGTDGLAMHMVGAMGRPGVIAVPAFQPWFWAARDGKAIWYPTIRVAGQKAPGSWSPVVEKLATAVEVLAGTQSSAVA